MEKVIGEHVIASPSRPRNILSKVVASFGDHKKHRAVGRPWLRQQVSKHERLRPKYQADLESASGKDIVGISAISKADAEGQFAFTFSHPLLARLDHVEVQVVPNEWSSYPAEHSFLAYAITEIPGALVEPLDSFFIQSSGLRVQEALAALSQGFISALAGGPAAAGTQPDENGGDQFMTDIDNGSESGSEFGGFDYCTDEDDEDEVFGLGSNEDRQTSTYVTAKVGQEVVGRIRRDFRTARAAGFKVGVLCGFEETVENNIVSLSVRVDKLCLSSETLEAWNITLDDYIVLLIRYDRHYTTLEEAYHQGAGLSNMKFCLRKYRRYKPSLHHALKAFHSDITTRSKATDSSDETESTLSELSLLGIGQSIDAFMDADFVPLLKLRQDLGLSWDQANKELANMSRNMVSGKSSSNMSGISSSETPSHDVDHMKLPAFIAKDHFKSEQELSLPLIAAQFAMRYFVRCTDYCMVCHQQVEGNFEALKPYVCGNSLCLFQYMSMGLGPSVNQEIRNQPNVVDLLISFCYAGLRVNKSMGSSRHGVRDFPTGLNLQVPKIFKSDSMPTHSLSYMIPPYTGVAKWLDPLNAGQQKPLEESADSIMVNGVVLVDPIKGRLDRNASTLELHKSEDLDKLKEGSWIAIVAMLQTDASGTTIFHGWVEDIIGTTVKVVVVSVLPHAAAQVGEQSDVHVVLYNQNLDDLDENRKAAAILMQLETLPSVATMRSYLAANPTQQIEKWDRLTPAASKLLRWVVASNRSYIVQVDECPTEDGEPEKGLARQQEHISGVDGWLQFRFAQGSPEKEVLFQEALQQVNKPHKTILAWHGSALSNWHSIIRQGLNFEQVHNGRAHGNGVYFGHDFMTSLGYSGNRSYMYDPRSGQKPYWPNSALKIASAVSLNELVNLPEQFVANNNFCMVVQHVHWIQCRCLFVQPEPSSKAAQTETQSAGSNTTVAKRANVPEFVQDSANEAKGTSGRLFVPRGAIPTLEDKGVQQASMSLKYDALGHQDDSEGEDEEDRTFLAMTERGVDDNAATTALSSEGLAVILDTSKTDFRPFSLDLDTLPKLSPPSYAAGQAQKTLAKEIQKLQATQSSVPIHELGWFIDFDKITNMFHWIVELHSFDRDMPLAKRMAKAGVTSVVLELRFGREFPYSRRSCA
ncbi:hypothetical protein PG994_001161 [Apiospora phragmitis]|uniref:PARP catalytic domain-containing protein n=1 Tax=Apiospora phragmitis TaxID=2905665 RepID=A0ABR1WSQ5_9PEZI